MLESHASLQESVEAAPLLKRPDRSEVIEYRPLVLADKAPKTA